MSPRDEARELLRELLHEALAAGGNGGSGHSAGAHSSGAHSAGGNGGSGHSAGAHSSDGPPAVPGRPWPRCSAPPPGTGRRRPAR